MDSTRPERQQKTGFSNSEVGQKQERQGLSRSVTILSGLHMKYIQHNDARVLKPGEQFVARGRAAPDLHALLERKGFKFLAGPADDYYRHGTDDEWSDPYKQPLICVYPEADSWGGRPFPDHPIKPNVELKDYLDSLPDAGV
jgi:hypothetical protein